MQCTHRSTPPLPAQVSTTRGVYSKNALVTASKLMTNWSTAGRMPRGIQVPGLLLPEVPR